MQDIKNSYFREDFVDYSQKLLSKQLTNNEMKIWGFEKIFTAPINR